MEPEQVPYWGSIRFCKHLILSTLALLILVPTCLAVFFGVSTHRLRTQLREATDSITLLTQEASPQEASLPEATPVGSPKLTAVTPSYQALFPQLYAKEAQRSTVLEEKSVYLTFDDGPTRHTPEILQILADYDVKATFFVTGRESAQSQQWMRDIVDAGHAIGAHSYSHDYHKIYESVDVFLEDFDQICQLVYEATGSYPQIFRFPGGSINAFNAATYQEIIAEMVRRGFVFFDWNTITGDAESGKLPAKQLQRNALSRVNSLYRSVLLMHDGENNGTTVEALPGIIEGYRDAGYHFEKLTPEVVPVVFGYPSQSD